MLVDLHPHVEHDALSGELQDPRLRVIERKRARKGGEVQGGDEKQAVEITLPGCSGRSRA